MRFIKSIFSSQSYSESNTTLYLDNYGPMGTGLTCKALECFQIHFLKDISQFSTTTLAN